MQVVLHHEIFGMHSYAALTAASQTFIVVEDARGLVLEIGLELVAALFLLLLLRPGEGTAMLSHLPSPLCS